MKDGTIFWRNRERWLKTKDGEVRMADLAPHLEAQWMLEHAAERINAELGWRKSFRGEGGGTRGD